MDILGRLFANEERVRLLRFFIFNPIGFYDLKRIGQKTKLGTRVLNRELAELRKQGFVEVGKLANRAKGWQFNQQYHFEKSLRKLFNAEVIINREKLANKFKDCGKIKILLVSGIFLEESADGVDLVIVGDSLKKSKIESAIRSLEGEIGKELVYAILSTSDFIYRLHSGDRFVRNMLDYPHHFIVKKLDF